MVEFGDRMSVKPVAAATGPRDDEEEELSTSMIFLSEGTDSDSTFEACRSGTSSLSKEVLSLGGLYGRFVSLPIIRCADSR